MDYRADPFFEKTQPRRMPWVRKTPTGGQKVRFAPDPVPEMLGAVGTGRGRGINTGEVRRAAWRGAWFAVHEVSCQPNKATIAYWYHSSMVTWRKAERKSFKLLNRMEL